MRLLRFFLWLRRKQRPLTRDQEWELTKRVMAERKPERQPIWDYRGCCRLCKRPKEDPVKFV